VGLKPVTSVLVVQPDSVSQSVVVVTVLQGAADAVAAKQGIGDA